VQEWHLNKDDLKKYPHFDPPISGEKAEAYATDEVRVARHAFYPFIRYWQRWTRFRKKEERVSAKVRPIRYAARLDSYIFSYYRHILARRYESELARLGLQSSILAYRRVPLAEGKGNKCNIHFARDAFLKIRELGECSVVALDIHSYFESLDHVRLKGLWCRLLEVDRLPADHFQVFRAITQYAIVDKEKVYERLAHFGSTPTINGSRVTRGYLTPYRDVPKHLCRGEEFRDKIAGYGDQKSIIERNYKPYGVPQGAPLSDLLANLYLLDFDGIVSGRVRSVGGYYYRYSDDILIIVPGPETDGLEFMERAHKLISEFGAKLHIKREKSSVFRFERDGTEQKFRLVYGEKGKNGLEYLGFRYDGKRVYLRDSTLSNLRRKVARAANRDAHACARRYPDKDAFALKSLFNYERLVKRFGRVEDFGEIHEDYRNWTFWTYAHRASTVFGPLGRSLPHQLKKHRDLIHWRADKALVRAVKRRAERRGQLKA
jgi:hypothetical protein